MEVNYVKLAAANQQLELYANTGKPLNKAAALYIVSYINCVLKSTVRTDPESFSVQGDPLSAVWTFRSADALGLGVYTVSDNIKAKAVRDKRDAEYAALTRGCTQRSRQKQFELMAKYDVFNEDGVSHRLTAHENGTNVFLEARKCIRRLMAKEGLPVDEYDLRIKFPGKDF